jgi:uncharacterized membrane protein YhiD involved in acid resistance
LFAGVGIAFILHLFQNVLVAALALLAVLAWYFLGRSLSAHVTEYDQAREDADRRLAEAQEELEERARQLRERNERARRESRQAALDEMDARIAALEAEAGEIRRLAGLFELKMLRSRPAREVLPLSELDTSIEALKGLHQGA